MPAGGKIASGRERVKVLIVGGTGFVGGYTALYFHDLGHDVTIMSRSPPKGVSRLNGLAFVRGNYIEDDFSDGRLDGYDWLIFCAGSDLHSFPTDGSVSQADFFEKANIIALPRFFEKARSSGISRAVYMGSFYSFVAPESTATIPYVRSRHLSDEAIRALSSPTFNVCSCALPFIVGYTPGFPVPHMQALAHYAQGRLEGMPEFAPPGGANYMTCRSVAEAMLGGLERGESGKSYLVGDVNLSWKEFFELWFKAAGRPRDLEVRAGHPIIPDFILSYLGFGRATDYEPPAEETALLGYQRGVLRREVEDCVRYYGSL
jgi:nucleoside-diphosphate-sugar epimerase